MTFLVPSFPVLTSAEANIAEMFSAMAHVMLESYAGHPTVFAEAMAFFEQLSLNQDLLPPPAICIRPSEDYLTCCMPVLLEGLTPDYPNILADKRWLRCRGVLSSIRGERVAVCCAKVLSLNHTILPGRYERRSCCNSFLPARGSVWASSVRR